MRSRRSSSKNADVAADVQLLEGMMQNFAKTVVETQEKISRVQNRLQKTGDDVNTLTERKALANSCSDSCSSSSGHNVNNQQIDDKENHHQTLTSDRRMQAELAVEKQRHGEEVRDLKEQVYTLKSQLISHSSSSYRKSITAMNERRSKIFSPTSVMEFESVCDDMTVVSDIVHEPAATPMNIHISQTDSSTTAYIDKLLQQLQEAKRETGVAQEACREILRRYESEMAASKKERETLQRELAESHSQLEESTAIVDNLADAVLEHEATTEAITDELAYLKGDVVLLQFQSEEYKVGLKRCQDALRQLSATNLLGLNSWK